MISVGYLAGFIDGEGSLSVNRIPRHERSTEYCVRLRITNSNSGILKDIQSVHGGTLARSPDRNPRWKRGYVLTWTNAAATRIIETVSPHLRVKARQAKALLEFAHHIRSCKRRRDEKGRLLPLSEWQMGIRRAFFRRLKLLNVRGKSQGPRPERSGMNEDRVRVGGKITPEYLAGFMDGEGSIMITRSSRRNSRGLSYRARIDITNTDRCVLEEIRDQYGGFISRQTWQNEAWNTGYHLIWTEGVIDRSLLRLRPRLRLKRRQADLVLRFLDHVRDSVRTREGRLFAPYPKSVWEFREAIFQTMKVLNMKGPETPAS